jgi:hypothetical protein
VHDAHEDRSRCDRPAHVIGVDATGPIYLEVGDTRTKALEKAGRLEDRGMLDRGRDDVVAAITQREKDAAEGEVVGLAATAREDDLVGAQPSREATWVRARSTMARAARPPACVADGLA